MNLILDIGNTNVKVAVFNAQNCLSFAVHKVIDTAVLSNITKQYSITNVGVASVVEIPKETTELLNAYFNNILYITNATALPIGTTYQSMQTVGVDRLANAVAAYKLSNGAALAIDMGTCITYDYVNQNGEFEGGGISPGFDMRFKALNTFTGKLPLVDANITDDIVGNTTEKSIKSGVYYGILNELKGVIAQYSEKNEKILVYLTGGNTKIFVSGLKNIIFADPLLTLKGLNEILIYHIN